LLVNFTNISVGAISFWWDLGDGSFSVVPSPSDLYTSSGYHTIYLVANNVYGCKDTAIGHVSIFGYGGEFTYAPLSGCAPLSVHFKAFITNVPSVIWDFADGTVSPASAIDSIDHIYTIPGAYVPKLILSDNTGCQNSSLGEDTIKVDAVRAGFITIPDPVCLNAPMYYQDTSSGYWAPITSWYWTFTNGDTSTLIAPTYVYTAVGTYPVNLRVTDGWGCVGIVNKDVTVYPPPIIQACPDTTICITDYATLSAIGGVSYVWGDVGTLSCSTCNPTRATPTVITTYTVTGTDEHGCKNTDTVTVYLKYKTISKAYSDTEICRGVTVQLLDTGGTKYTWIPGTGLSNPNISDPLASPTTTTRYLAIAQLAGCIPDSNYVMITVHQLPTVDAGPDQTLLAGSEAQITAKGYLVDKWIWGNAESLSCDSCSNPIATMSVTTTYPVIVLSDFGCINSDTITIRLFCDQSQIFVPNTFTPNGDGQNDVFYPRGKGVSIVNTFRIYNRWGELLFERTNFDLNDVSSAWDGTYQGEVLKPDVYVFIVTALCDSGEPLSVKGDVTLIK
jgi:gliding motility-associated-like protein